MAHRSAREEILAHLAENGCAGVVGGGGPDTDGHPVACSLA
ncbi:hypothetical protein [Microbacterium lemovicicum]|nr:hypothetical protein [Microbacterium lemovicicum]